jgi:hypothetical protein
MKTETTIKKTLITQVKEKTSNESSDDHCLRPSGKKDGVVMGTKTKVPIPSLKGADGKKKQNRKLCSVAHCNHIAKRAGVCVSHGATQKRCSIDECKNCAHRHGLCVRHGGGVPCRVEGCTFNAFSAREGLCGKHGATSACTIEWCISRAMQSGLCNKHTKNVKACTHKGCVEVVYKAGECVWHIKSLLSELRCKYKSSSSPIPSQQIGAGWEAATDPSSGKEYYFHPIRDQWSFTRPILSTEVGKQIGEIPQGWGWETSKDPSTGIVYHFDGSLFESWRRNPTYSMNEHKEESLRKMDPIVEATKMPTGANTHSSSNSQQMLLDEALKKHRDLTLSLLVQAAARGEASIPVSAMLSARELTMKRMKDANLVVATANYTKALTIDDMKRKMTIAESAAVQKYVTSNDPSRMQRPPQMIFTNRQQQSDKKRFIQRHVYVLEHAFSCTSSQCNSSNCLRMKTYINHGEQCKVRLNVECSVILASSRS